MQLYEAVGVLLSHFLKKVNALQQCFTVQIVELSPLLYIFNVYLVFVICIHISLILM